MKVLFLQSNLQSQKFDQAKLLVSLRVPHGFLTHGVCIAGRVVRIGVLREIMRERPDVILGYEAGFITMMAILLKKLHLVRADIWTFMDDSPRQIRERKGVRRIVRDFVIRNVSRVIVPSQDAVEAYCAANCGEDSSFFVLPIVHDTEVMRKDAHAVYGLGEEWKQRNIPSAWRKVLLFVGRLTAIKNIPWLIERMTELPADVGLVVVGDGEEAFSLKERVASFGLDTRVVFTGRREGNGLYALMAMADGLVLCSHSERFGAVVAEALQWGCPCAVSTCVGAYGLIEDGVNGRLFVQGDAKPKNRS